MRCMKKFHRYFCKRNWVDGIEIAQWCLFFLFINWICRVPLWWRGNQAKNDCWRLMTQKWKSWWNWTRMYSFLFFYLFTFYFFTILFVQKQYAWAAKTRKELYVVNQIKDSTKFFIQPFNSSCNWNGGWKSVCRLSNAGLCQIDVLTYDCQLLP